MLRSPVVLAALVTLCAPAPAHAFETDGWTWEQAIDGPLPSGFVMLPLPREVLERAQPDMDDLRVLDRNDDLVPHVLDRENVANAAQLESRPVTLINQTFSHWPRYAQAVLDFGSPFIKNQVDVDLSGNNFRRRALLEGSPDSVTWDKVAENLWLFDVSQEPNRHFTAKTLQFPTNNFRYLRLTVYNMPDDPERIEILRVTSAQAAPESAAETERVVLQAGAPRRDLEKKHTTWEFDLGSGNLPVRSFDLQIADAFFHRGYELEGRNSVTEAVQTPTETAVTSTTRDTPWQPVRSGVLYRVVYETTTTQNLTLEGLGPTPRYLRLRVHDADNPPLTVERATASVVYPKLIWSAAAGNQYRLIYGNQAAGSPQYDLGQSVRNLEAGSYPLAKLGAASKLSHADKPAPWTERNATWLVMLLVAAALAFGAMLFGSLRKLPPAKE